MDFLEELLEEREDGDEPAPCGGGDGEECAHSKQADSHSSLRTPFRTCTSAILFSSRVPYSCAISSTSSVPLPHRRSTTRESISVREETHARGGLLSPQKHARCEGGNWRRVTLWRQIFVWATSEMLCQAKTCWATRLLTGTNSPMSSSANGGIRK